MRTVGASRRSERGFTLVELLVALVLLGLLSALLYAGLSHGARSWTSVERRSDGSAAVASAQAFLRERLASIPRPAPENRQAEQFQGGGSGFSFTAPWTSHPPVATIYRTEVVAIAEAGEQVLRLRWRPEEATQGLGRLERARLAGSRDLVPGLRDLEFRYYGDPAGGAEEAWHDGWNSPAGPPKLVLISARSLDPALTWPRFVVAIP